MKTNKDSKQMLFEMMAKLNPDLKLNKNGTVTKRKLNEYNNYDYPAGADADPNAPWHQVDDEVDEYIDWDFDKYHNIILNSQHGGTYNVDWEFLAPEDRVFDMLHNNPNNPELHKIIDTLIIKFLETSHGRNIDWDYPEPDGEPSDYGRDVDEGFGTGEEEQGVKFRADVAGVRENVWSTNAKEYNTEEEAKKWLDGLSDRWNGYDMSRVVPSTTPRNQPVDMQNDVIYQNYRKINEGWSDNDDNTEAKSNFRDRERNAGVEPEDKNSIKKQLNDYVKVGKTFMKSIYYKPYMGRTDGKLYSKVGNEYV